jgi:hypothetical protein
LGQDVTGIEVEKACLIRSYLVDPDVCITRLDCLRDRRNVANRIRAADDRLRNILLRNGAGSLRKMGRESEV